MVEVVTENESQQNAESGKDNTKPQDMKSESVDSLKTDGKSQFWNLT